MIRVGILGATGMVGQHYVSLLHKHPWFQLTLAAASPQSAGKPYREAIQEWFPKGPLAFEGVLAEGSLEEICAECDLVFSCMGGGEALEWQLAEKGITVISHNALHRNDLSVPLIIPEINSHALGKSRLIAKPNCAIQSYVLPLAPLRPFGIEHVIITTLQSLSGAGREAMQGETVTPIIPGEEEKCESEPQRILERSFSLSATCVRVPIPYGHYATISVQFKHKPTREEILQAWEEFPGLDLPIAPKRPLHVDFSFDIEREGGMAITVGHLRSCPVLDWKFVALSHNVVRGAAGGGVLTAECIARAAECPRAKRKSVFS